MSYQKAKVEVLHNMPVAGGCGDTNEYTCAAMGYSKHGPGCGDSNEYTCKQQGYSR